jgi:hypothetical protein
MSIEQECIAILAQDLGPAARAFLDRQCRQYLRKETSALEIGDVEELAKWCAIETQRVLGVQVAENVKKNLLAIRR